MVFGPTPAHPRFQSDQESALRHQGHWRRLRQGGSIVRAGVPMFSSLCLGCIQVDFQKDKMNCSFHLLTDPVSCEDPLLLGGRILVPHDILAG